MPKIPLDLSGGMTGDTDAAVSDVLTANLYPQKDRFTGKVIAKGMTSSSQATELAAINRLFGGIVAPAQSVVPLDVSESIYTVADDPTGGAGLRSFGIYEGAILRAAGTFVDLSPQATDGDCRLATNGINIVGVFTASDSVSADDFVYDIATGVMTSLPTADANYSGFGKANDVTYQDGRYFFTTDSVVFHGDLKTDAGQGVAFSAISFAESPFADQAIRGIASLDSNIYVLSSKQSVIYQNVGTVPFTLQLNTSVEINAGVSKAMAKIEAFGKLYTLSSSKEGEIDLYVISGSNSNRVGNGEISRIIGQSGGIRANHIMTAYTDGKSNFVQAKIQHKFGLSDDRADVVVYDEIADRFHFRSVKRTSDGNIQSDGWPFLFYYKREYNELEMLGHNFGATVPGTVAIFKHDESSGDISQYIQSFQEPNNVHYFNYIRNDGEPFSLKSARLSLSNVATAELFISDDGLSYISLGLFDVSANDNGAKICEWRRINRQLSQAMFKLEITIDSSDNVMAILDGSIVV